MSLRESQIRTIRRCAQIAGNPFSTSEAALHNLSRSNRMDLNTGLSIDFIAL